MGARRICGSTLCLIRLAVVLILFSLLRASSFSWISTMTAASASESLSGNKKDEKKNIIITIKI